MTQFDHSTREVSWMTSIPIRTIQEYVSTFRAHFSDKASQTKKGRRFLPADIDKLHMIKRLRAERVPDDEINKFLAGEIEIPFKLSHQFKDVEVKNIAARSLEIFARADNLAETAQEVLRDAKQMISEAKAIQQQTRMEVQAVRNEIHSVWETVGKFRKWQVFVMQYDPELNPYHKDDPKEPTEANPDGHKSPKPSLIGRLLGE